MAPLKTKTIGSAARKRAMRILKQSEAVPRFQRARQAKALIDAIQCGDSKLAVWLLKLGVDPDATDNRKRSALWWAAQRCRPAVIVELVKRGARLPDDVLFGPISHGGDEKLIRLLIKHGANVNCYGREYSPFGHQSQLKSYVLSRAMALASMNGRESIPIMLIRAGAKINRLVQPKEGCVFMGRSPEGSENRSMLGLAATSGLRKTVQAMIAAGANVNMRDNRGRTALADAIESGHTEIANVLTKAGARR